MRQRSLRGPVDQRPRRRSAGSRRRTRVERQLARAAPRRRRRRPKRRIVTWNGCGRPSGAERDRLAVEHDGATGSARTAVDELGHRAVARRCRPRVKTRTSSPSRCTCTRAPSSFHSNARAAERGERLGRRPPRSAASIGWSGRKSSSGTPASPAAPRASAARATAGRSPASITARRTSARGDARCRARSPRPRRPRARPGAARRRASGARNSLLVGAWRARRARAARAPRSVCRARAARGPRSRASAASTSAHARRLAVRLGREPVDRLAERGVADADRGPAAARRRATRRRSPARPAAGGAAGRRGARSSRARARVAATACDVATTSASFTRARSASSRS